MAGVNKHLRIALLSSAGAMVLINAAPGAAKWLPEQRQAQSADTTPARTNRSNVPEGITIIVTAQKRAQVLVDVPQSVSVVSGATLEKQQAKSFADYLKLVPGLQLNQSTPGEGRLIVRGVNTGGVASTVGVYVDETPFGSSSGLVNAAILAGDFDPFDLNRIEVLRGPQGTLYGASSLSGVLKFVTNLPTTDRLLVRARTGIESVKGGELGYSGNLVVNVPLGPTLALRASGTYRKDGGFIDSIGTGGSDIKKNINDDRSYGGRASLLFKPRDTLSLRLTAIAQNINADAPSIVESDPVTLKPLYGRLSQSQFVPQFTDIKYRVYNGTGTFGLGFADLTTSTSYATQNQRSRTDLTNALSGLIGAIFSTPNELFEPQRTENKKFTQEVRLSAQSARFDWLIGGYYTNEKGLILQDFTAVAPGTFTPIAGLPLLAHAVVTSKYRELAGFADATIHFGERFDLDLGGRYSHNKQSAHQISDGALAGGFNDFPVARSSENVFTYSAAPKFKVNPNTSIYARVAKGFRPGGPNILPPGAPAGTPNTYKSDSVISYEAGVKAVSPDRRFSIDAAAFHIDWKRIQLFATVNGFGVNANGGSARSDGFELTATARPVRGLDLSINGAYTHARLTETTPPEVGGRKGDQLPFSPKLSFGLNGDYQFPIGATTTAHVGGSYRHLSGQTATYDRDFVAAYGRQRHVRPYGVFDLLAGFDFGRFNLEGYIKNVGNSHGVTSTTGLTVFGASPDSGFPIYPNGAIGTGIIRPRTIGVSLGTHF